MNTFLLPLYLVLLLFRQAFYFPYENHELLWEAVASVTTSAVVKLIKEGGWKAVRSSTHKQSSQKVVICVSLF